MKNKINILSEKIISKITSEETIKNFSSIIKELIDNSIDANSKNISIYIDNFTDNLTVIDDGNGISKNDVNLCYLKGSTSKIKNLNDLINIKTIGFRGNALYSISNISILEIITKNNTNKIGTKIIIEYGKIKKKIPYYCNIGSSFTVSNIFLNFLYKKDFLLSKKKEYYKIIKNIKKNIICYNKINFKLYHNNKLLFFYNKNSILNRLYNIYFKELKFNKNIFLIFKKKINKIKFKIFLLNPIYLKKYKKKIYKYIFVNNKFIINNDYYCLINNKLFKYLNKKNIIYFFFIKIDSKKVNFNILPDKSKVIFKKKIKIKNLINKFLEFFLNKNYFINKKILNNYFLKKKKKKKKNIYINNKKKIKYIKKFLILIKKKKKIKIILFNKKYIFLLKKNKFLILNIKRIKEKFIYYYYYNNIKFFFKKKKKLFIPLKFKLPYFLNKKKINFFLKKINKFFIVKKNKNKIIIYNLPIIFNKKIIIKVINSIFLLLNNNNFKIKIKKIILIFISKIINKKYFLLKDKLFIKKYIIKKFIFKNNFLTPNNKKMFFFLKKKHFK
ncbi:MAG: DNA mismatch repair endonuclease MutL [Candidatus Shikimatogenerans bostrichidophilus]|nr:MAG: DNA mismatch repair endonuclease MutL [Candidatus Shikimatogenerans bostrichidophilus]